MRSRASSAKGAARQGMGRNKSKYRLFPTFSPALPNGPSLKSRESLAPTRAQLALCENCHPAIVFRHVPAKRVQKMRIDPIVNTKIWCMPVLKLVQGRVMRASVTLDDDLLKTAHEYTGITERAELLREALKSIIAREAGRRLVALAGTAPKIKNVRRRRVDEP
jgi:Arc/MetJ family transcription regulator